MDNKSSRRDFLRLAAGTTAGLSAAALGLSGCGGFMTAPPKLVKSAPLDKVRIGFVGVGSRGTLLVSHLLLFEGVEVKAICDIVPEKVERIQKTVEEAGQPKPTGYSRGDTDFVRMCETEDLDIVFNAAPWRWHTPISVAAMKNGKHAATEIPAAITQEDCWKLVETSEKYNKYCTMLENVCYTRTELMLLNMIRQDLFGQVVHCEGGYRHDRIGKHFDARGNLTWRAEHYAKHDNNPYPCHPIGPIAWWMNINRGDRLDYLVSMSTASNALNWEAEKLLGPDHPLVDKKFALGDINCSMIKTVNEKTITLYHDTQLPRPYSRINNISAQRGVFNDFALDSIADLPYEGLPGKIHIQGRSPEHMWEMLDSYAEEFEHPLWKKIGEQAKGYGHSGADYIILYRLVECLRKGKPLDIDVYDAATWSVISDLTERSATRRSARVKVPDFTRGRWKTNKPITLFDV